MSRITTVLTTPAGLEQDPPVEPEAAPAAPARKPSKSDAAKADVAAEIEETP
jgi:hypothetical protein